MFSFIADHAADMSNQSPGEQYHIFKSSKQICVHIQQAHFNLYCVITHHAVKKKILLFNECHSNESQTNASFSNCVKIL